MPKGPEDRCQLHLAYVEAGHYDNTIFHRVIKNFA